MNRTNEAYRIVLNDILNRNIGLFQGKYDAVNGDEKFMYGINTVMSFIAYEAGDYDFEDSFMNNMIECEERARNNE